MTMPTLKPKKLDSFLDHLYRLDYKERPVSFEYFISSPDFLGSLTNNGRSVYQVWKDTMSEVMMEDSKYVVVLTGAIGIGKTRIAIWGMCYVLYRLLCLKDPWQFFSKASGGRMAVVFFNLTKNLGESKGFGLLQTCLKASPWFLKHGSIRGKGEEAWLDIPLFVFLLSSPYAKGFGTQGQDVITAIMDEVDSPTESDKQRVRVLKAYENTVRRFQSRFVDDIYGESIGKFFLVASKQDEMSFLNTFVDEMRGSKYVYVKDLAYWEVRPKSELSPHRFSVMIGDVYRPSRIISTKKERKELEEKGYRIIDVPMNFYEAFARDIDGALKDIAGMSVIGIRRSKLFSSEAIVKKCMSANIKCPLTKRYVEIGLKDEIDLVKFIDFSKILQPKHVSRYIHTDVAYSGDGDAMSISMACPIGYTTTEVELADGRFEKRKVAIVQTEFTMRLKAPPGDQIPIHKMRKLVLDILAMGYNIVKYTADLALLSTDTMQILTRRGIKCESLSLDKTTVPYIVFKDLVTEERWVCYEDPILYLELVNLQHDKAKNKIDHPDKVKDMMISKEGGMKEIIVKGSKDMSDATAGAVYGVLLDTDSIPVDGEFVKAMSDAMKTDTTDPRESLLANYWWLDKDRVGNEIEEKETDRQEEAETNHQLAILKAMRGRL